MKAVIVGATGAIGGAILQQAIRREELTDIIALTRKPLKFTSPSSEKLSNILIENFGDLDNVPDTTWNQLVDADALIWAMGTYDLNPDVNLNYPLAFQEEFEKRRASKSRTRQGVNRKFCFILLSGAFVETDQSRRLFFLWDQRRMKGLLQTRTLEFADARTDGWEAIVIRPGGVLFGGNTWRNWAVEIPFGTGLAIRGEELGACVTDLAVTEPERRVIENREMVERGRKVLREMERATNS